ncbi:MAG: AmmeMemoRadiSam system radical SAM enzyme [Spirochaetota bacterium]
MTDQTRDSEQLAPVPRYMTEGTGEILCTLCAHLCHIRPGQAGLCQVRTNDNGRPCLPYYGKVSALHVDPVEKKPLYHFHPGAELLSIGFLGCNFRCPFCQNYSISQSTTARTRDTLPSEIPALARDAGVLGVAYTYNEPTIHFEYLMEAAERARDAGLANVVVTNGHLTRKPARELLARMDAANVDLKSFNPEFYSRELAGDLEAVKDFLRIAAEETSLEVTTLLIPGKNDSDDEVEAIASFVASLDPDIPFHLSGYYPTYQYVVEATSPSTIEHARDIARGHLNHVYRGNVSGDSSTRCSSCGSTLVQRSGYRTDPIGLRGDTCAKCGAPSPIRWFRNA